MGQARVSDIARELGISKASVSLALNNKPGVSASTREAILACKKRLESSSPAGTAASGAAGSRKQVNILMASRGMHNIQGAELDLWTDVRMVFDRTFREEGISLGLIYLDVRNDQEVQDAVRTCAADDIVGVILQATEFQDQDLAKFRGIRKPMVIYDFSCDYRFSDSIRPLSFICINNRQAVHLAVTELYQKGNRDIIYLGMDIPMYNYESRKRAFLEEWQQLGFSDHDARRRLIRCSDSIDGSYRFMKDYLQHNALPQAFLTESYHLSIGAIRALTEAGVKIPLDVSIVGIDKIPDYLTSGLNLTCIRISHTERARWAAKALLREMETPDADRLQLYVNCQLVPGQTVAVRSRNQEEGEPANFGS